jgi:hypothetical protein
MLERMKAGTSIASPEALIPEPEARSLKPGACPEPEAQSPSEGL